jgi:Leucine-rich repeat (LRR) protein
MDPCTLYNYVLHLSRADTQLIVSGKGLTQLDVSQNQLSNVPSNALKNLHHLLILNLNYNRIGQVHNRAFEGLDTLEILTLYENKLTVVESDAFRGLEK